MLSLETHRGNREASGEPSYGRFLYNYYRTYDPKTGRYLEADPIGQSGGVNLFAYARSRPTMYADRSGLTPGGVPEPCSPDCGLGFEQMKKCCENATPLSGKGGVNPYPPSYSYRGVSGRAMYRYGGEGEWGRFVRGCLVCMYRLGADTNAAHWYCYIRGAGVTGYVSGTAGFVDAVIAAGVIKSQQSVYEAVSGREGVQGIGNLVP